MDKSKDAVLLVVVVDIWVIIESNKKSIPMFLKIGTQPTIDPIVFPIDNIITANTANISHHLLLFLIIRLALHFHVIIIIFNIT